MIERGNPLSAVKRITDQASNLEECSIFFKKYWPCSLKRPEALLYVFEDNEAVIKMIMKGRSRTMRHVFRTHRVALGYSIDQFGPKNPNQVHRHQKSTRRHLDQREFHTWWVESFVDSVLISAILALLPAPLQWQNELNKNQEKNESQQNRDQWWIFLQGRRGTYRPLLH